MNLPLDYLNTLYKIVIDRAKEEARRLEEEEKIRIEREKQEKRQFKRNKNKSQLMNPPRLNMSRQQMEDFEDELEDML